MPEPCTLPDGAHQCSHAAPSRRSASGYPPLDGITLSDEEGHRENARGAADLGDQDGLGAHRLSAPIRSLCAPRSTGSACYAGERILLNRSCTRQIGATVCGKGSRAGSMAKQHSVADLCD